MNHRAPRWLALALPLLGCGDSPGTVSVTLWGEEFATVGIPPVAGEEPGFEDGWTVRFSRFLVNVGAVTVGSGAGAQGGSLPGYRVWNLSTLTGPIAVGALSDVSSERMDAVSWRLAPATTATSAGNATADDLRLMQQGGYSLYAEGEATRAGSPSVRLRWGFSNTTAFTECRDSQGQAGVAVPSGGEVTAQLTVHIDHLFYDDLQAETAKIRFDAIAAADADRDGEVTLEELSRVDLTTLPQGRYGTGSVPRIYDLRQFVTFLTATVGHFNGEGECHPERVTP